MENLLMETLITKSKTPETTEQRLLLIMGKINTIHIDTLKQNLSMSQKLQNYHQSDILISEASDLLDKLQSQLDNIQIKNIDKSKHTRINEMLQLINVQNPSFNIILSSLEELESIASGLPTESEIINNINNDKVIYIEENV